MDEMRPYFEAFWYLSAKRQQYVGMSAVIEGNIQESEIQSFFEIRYITDLEERLDYLKFITVMDHEYLRVKQELNKQPEDKDPKKPPKKGKK